jgi:hypothetical protein
MTSEREFVTLQPENPNPDKYMKIQGEYFPKECVLIWEGDGEILRYFRRVRVVFKETTEELEFQIKHDRDEQRIKTLTYDLYHLYELETLYKAVYVARSMKKE